MSEKRNSDWYSGEAERLRKLAETEADPALRNSFLELATAYDRLALTLQRVGSLVRR